jgi:hypothetical protein
MDFPLLGHPFRGVAAVFDDAPGAASTHFTECQNELVLDTNVLSALRSTEHERQQLVLAGFSKKYILDGIKNPGKPGVRYF